MRRLTGSRAGSWTGVALAAVLALGVGASHAAGQCNIQNNAATGVMTPATQEAIRACAEAAKGAFTGGDYQQIKRVRDALISPLRQPRVTTEFRVNLESALRPVLREAAASENIHAALNALVIAGELANAPDVLRAGLEDERADVRFMAASQLQRMFQIIGADSAPAVLAVNVDPAVKALSMRVGVEQDPAVAEALVLALDAAARIGTSGFEVVSQAAVEGLSNAVGDRIAKGVGPSFNPMVQRATDALGWVVREAAGTRARLDEKTRKGIARFVGDALTHAACRVEKAGADGGISPEERERLTAIVGSAETLFGLVGTTLGDRNTDALGLQANLASGERDTVFVAGVRELAGRLEKAPYNADKGRFVGKCE